FVFQREHSSRLRLAEVAEREEEPPSWFTSSWLYVETYMYRRIQEAQYDVFQEQKEKALSDSHEAVMILLKYLLTLVQEIEEGKKIDTQLLFKEFMQVCLWGNKCDLSISAGLENSQKSCPLDQVNTLRPYILIDDLDTVWNKIVSSGPGRVDIILDNAGFEVATDLCLAEFLLTSKLATSVNFHAKAFSWFVSDVTPVDFENTLQRLMMCNSMATDFFLKRWKGRLEDGTWKLQVHDFWTTPFPYCEMKSRSPDLYEELSKSKLLIFKGDLNYRKLLSDLDWPTTTPFETSLQGFGPSPLVSLRALKADLVTGLQEGQVEKVAAQDANWMRYHP
ncbi:ARMT1-like protein, partial [Mya arenaria]